MISAIEKRHSIRKYKDMPVPRQEIEGILRAGILAPSAMNRQPWRFVVTSGKAKDEAMEFMEHGLEREQSAPLLPSYANHIRGVKRTIDIMRQAPTVIFVVNEQAADFSKALTAEDRIMEIFDTQSIGAAVENMALEAVERGLGTVWIGYTFFAQEELREWLGTEGQPIAAMALGYPDEAPNARPRKGIDEAAEWRE